MQFIFFLTFLLFPTMVVAQDQPNFILPIDCKLNKDCWVLNYVDTGNPEDGKHTDHKCFSRTYDGHKGTDIAIRNMAVMNKGVNVLAAMEGKVERLRDGEPDRFPTDSELNAVKASQKECGNAVLIEHGNGLQTMYCHLKKGSISVKIGDRVNAGDKIGQVGLSGYTQFPHIHFGIVREGAILDPYTGLNNTMECGNMKQPLWAPALGITYQPAAIYDAGFLNAVPELDKIDMGNAESTSLIPKEPALTFWVSFLGVRVGDIITMNIKDPDGKIFAKETIKQPKDKSRQFYFIGRDLSERTLQKGTYVGNVQLIRATENGENKIWKTSRSATVR